MTGGYFIPSNTAPTQTFNYQLYHKKVTEIKELTPELVHEFVSRIEVHKPYRENGVRYQQIDIYYHGVGIIRLATAEEMEEAFQNAYREKAKK